MQHTIVALQSPTNSQGAGFSALALVPPAPASASQRQYLVADRTTLAKDPDFAAELVRQSDVVIVVGEREAAVLAAGLPAEVVTIETVSDLDVVLEGATTGDSVVLAVEETEVAFEIVKDVLNGTPEHARLAFLERQVEKLRGRLRYLEEHFSWSMVSRDTGLNLAPPCVLCGRPHEVGPCAA